MKISYKMALDPISLCIVFFFKQLPADNGVSLVTCLIPRDYVKRNVCVCGRQILFISLMLKHSHHKE